MNLFRSLQTALTNLRVNKLRSILTMLGVIIGVSAVIVMVALVEGVRAKVVSEFQRLGSDLIIIAFQPTEEQMRQNARIVENLTMEDVRRIKAECDLVENLSAEMGAGNAGKARYRDREAKVSPNGVQSDYPRLRNVTVNSGRFLTAEDEENWSKVVVIGDKVKKELFLKEDPIGKDIDIQNVTFTVVGVMAPKGEGGAGGEDMDRQVLGPITTIQKRLIGRDIVGVIWAQPRNTKMVDAAMDQVWQCLMRLHKNAPGFRVDSQQNILNAIGRILTLFGLVLGGVAGLALLVGGIGVMNIMLVSVTERTREIGIRKAVGAKQRDILIQFLIESATVTGVGGLIGISLGAGVSYAVGAITKQFMKGGMGGPGGDPGIPIHLPLWAILGAFLFSAFVGVFFGMYPAVRAARLDPIQALRHE
jgi:putative ABC transport system permease protein